LSVESVAEAAAVVVVDAVVVVVDAVVVVVDAVVVVVDAVVPVLVESEVEPVTVEITLLVVSSIAAGVAPANVAPRTRRNAMARTIVVRRAQP
jgi:hypothetical protein